MATGGICATCDVGVECARRGVTPRQSEYFPNRPSLTTEKHRRGNRAECRAPRMARVSVCGLFQGPMYSHNDATSAKVHCVPHGTALRRVASCVCRCFDTNDPRGPREVGCVLWSPGRLLIQCTQSAETCLACPMQSAVSVPTQTVKLGSLPDKLQSKVNKISLASLK